MVGLFFSIGFVLLKRWILRDKKMIKKKQIKEKLIKCQAKGCKNKLKKKISKYGSIPNALELCYDCWNTWMEKCNSFEKQMKDKK